MTLDPRLAGISYDPTDAGNFPGDGPLRIGGIGKEDDVFDAGGRSIPSMMELWPGLLALAVALNLAELIMRKGKSLFARA